MPPVSLLAATTLFLLALFSSAEASVSSYSGLYVRIDPSYTGMYSKFENAIDKNFVDGVSIMVQWSSIEPGPESYDFARLDKWIIKAVSQGKHISLGLMAGWFTPKWLYEGYNVEKLTFRFNRNPQGSPVCSDLDMPAPWNPQFISQYNKAVNALARHLREMPIDGFPRGSAYDAVRIVKISGINNTTEELRLPAGKGDRGPCFQSDAEKTWADAGFRPQRIVDAWNAIAQNTNLAFPDRILSIDVIQVGAFPPIDDEGRLYAPHPGSTDILTDRIIEFGMHQYLGRFSVQWNALSQVPPNPAVIRAGQRGAIVGWQLNQSLGPAGGTACFYQEGRLPCRSSDDFRKILDNGLNLGGQFIEIWAPNVDDYAAVFEEVHERLKNGRSRL